MLNKLIDLARTNNCKKINLEVSQSNKPAINLYNKYNFKQVGLRKNYYEKTGENAILMTLYL